MRCGRRRYCRAVAFDPDLLAPLRGDPATAGIFSDFDGTLSPIVADPELAEPLPGIAPLLGELARRYRVVAVVSGRPVEFLAAHLPASILLAGLYGLEVQHLGEPQTDPEAERWRTVVSAAATRIRAAAPPGVLVEPKGLSVTFHYRANPGARAAGDSLGPGGSGDDRTGRASRPQVRGAAFPRFVRTRARSSGTGLPAFVLPAISKMTSATWLRSLRSTSWPPGGSPQPGSRCAAMRRPLQAADMILDVLRTPPSCCRRCCSRREGAMRAPRLRQPVRSASDPRGGENAT